MEVTPLSGGHPLQFFEYPGEVGGIGVAHPLGHLADARRRVGHQPLGLADPLGVEQVIEGLAQVLVGGLDRCHWLT